MKSVAESINTCLASYSGAAFEDAMEEGSEGWGDGVLEGGEGGEGAQRRKGKGRGGNTCVICMNKRANVVFFPCKHMRCCAGCSERMEDCPICRVKVEEKLFVYV